ncbi:hypothetical protein ACHAWF_002476 [Thalassiosira exigua]
MVYIRNMDKEVAEMMQQYEAGNGNACAGLSILFGVSLIVVGVVFLPIGYHDHNSYTSRGDPLLDFDYLGEACKLQEIYYDTHEIEERRLLLRGHHSQQRQRLLPPSPPETRCYETWEMSFELSSAGKNYTNRYERRACSSECSKCKDSRFWGKDTDKVIDGVHLQLGKMVKCWEKADPYYDLELWDCYNSDCDYKIRDPSIMFNESKEYKRSQSNIITGWVTFGCGVGFCVLAICIESWREYDKSRSQSTTTDVNDPITINMGEPILDGPSIPTSLNPNNWEQNSVLEQTHKCNRKLWKISTVSMGNTHAVIFVDDLENDIDFESDGPAFSNDTGAFPGSTNVEFVQVIAPTHLKIKVWERYAGSVLQCWGTASCASVVVAIRAQKIPRPKNESTVKVEVADLHEFKIEWRERDTNVYMTGPATIVIKQWTKWKQEPEESRSPLPVVQAKLLYERNED